MCVGGRVVHVNADVHRSCLIFWSWRYNICEPCDMGSRRRTWPSVRAAEFQSLYCKMFSGLTLSPQRQAKIVKEEEEGKKYTKEKFIDDLVAAVSCLVDTR